MLYFQPATVTLSGVCHSQPAMWTQATACVSPLPLDHTVRIALYVFAYDFPFMQSCGFLLPLPGRGLVLLIVFLVLLYFNIPVVKVFTLKKSVNTINQSPPSC